MSSRKVQSHGCRRMTKCANIIFTRRPATDKQTRTLKVARAMRRQTYGFLAHRSRQVGVLGTWSVLVWHMGCSEVDCDIKPKPTNASCAMMKSTLESPRQRAAFWRSPLTYCKNDIDDILETLCATKKKTTGHLSGKLLATPAKKMPKKMKATAVKKTTMANSAATTMRRKTASMSVTFMHRPSRKASSPHSAFKEVLPTFPCRPPTPKMIAKLFATVYKLSSMRPRSSKNLTGVNSW
mmetsp:Transcript_52312/g.124842  ORF Transcript_52312/g.124842 Transcript_52312/m.124842 type:complete len:238 (-) Transcript_52312:254-967(-)